jgi:hypothetical protein
MMAPERPATPVPYLATPVPYFLNSRPTWILNRPPALRRGASSGRGRSQEINPVRFGAVAPPSRQSLPARNATVVP